MQINELRDDTRGVLDLDGVTHEVDLSLIENPKVGDYVIVHAGFAIERLDREEAESRLELFEELAAHMDAPGDS
jgi:hydrogenase expression/formation protein HypC